MLIGKNALMQIKTILQKEVLLKILKVRKKAELLKLNLHVINQVVQLNPQLLQEATVVLNVVRLVGELSNASLTGYG
jgi:hypothetical protein